MVDNEYLNWYERWISVRFKGRLFESRSSYLNILYLTCIWTDNSNNIFKWSYSSIFYYEKLAYVLVQVEFYLDSIQN